MTDRRTFLRPLRTRSIVVDAVWAGIAALLFTAPIDLELEHASPLAVVAACVAIALRRLTPSGAMVVTVVLGAVQVTGGERPSLVDLAIAVVIGTAAVVGTRTEAVLAGVLAVVAGASASLYLATTGYRYALLLNGPRDQVVLVLAAPALVLLSVWAAGLAGRAVRSQNAEAVRRADAEAAASRAEAVANRAEAVATRAVDEAEAERIRADIARDVHDVVGHSLAVIIAQADSVPFLDDEARIREVSATIASTARSSLVEVRQVLGHIDGPDATTDPTSFEEIVRGIREAGVDVEHTVRGVARPLGAVHGTAARRVLQEMLTNALRHGVPGGAVEVRETWRSADLVLEVENAVPASALPVGGELGLEELAASPATGEQPTAPTSTRGSGRGLTGMQTRLTTIGGSFDAAVLDAVFSARARIPFDVRRGTTR
ncbi:two-component sensor histidine kinase [Curtobacterium sp. MCSS17_008]|uniref:sensor histidine kinase n=1 Tax=Curtobacterium sp. MCSS17_008 TaxID=2175647 RepID=UPI000DAA8B30|nr:histidine kinase [Curtobacterium sp. MCSS17_008]PZF56270.1 two-component sensor histidine kinase [Curtobacterium sp. MCSS17_008]